MFLVPLITSFIIVEFYIDDKYSTLYLSFTKDTYKTRNISKIQFVIL